MSRGAAALATGIDAPRALTSLLPFSAGSASRSIDNSRLFRTSAAWSAPEEAIEQPEETIEQIRSRIFGTHIGDGLRSGRKVLRAPLLGEKLAAYYPEDIVKADPLMISIKAEKAKLKLDRLKRRGKAPPKKGAGKRAGKK
jgi:small subunit ribosomal protein S33